MKRWKKLLAGLLAMVMVMAFPCVPSYGLTGDAGEDPVEGDYQYQVNGAFVTITKYQGEGVTAEIPEEIAGKKVTVIGENAFSNCTKLEEIKIPVSVKEIGGMCVFRLQRSNEHHDSH